jgi:hypothetical protein
MDMGNFISQNRMNPKTSLCLSLATAAVQYETCSLLPRRQPPCLNTIIEPLGSYRAAQTE